MGSGGAERVVSLLSAEMDRTGHEVTVILRQKQRREARFAVSESIRVFDLHDSWEALSQELPGLRPESKALSFFRTRRPHRVAHRVTRLMQRLRLRSVVERIQPDVVLAFMVTTNIETTSALWRSRIPVIVSERSDPGRFEGDWIKRYFRNKWYGRAHGLVFQTEDARSFFSSKIQAKSTVIFNPLELSQTLTRTPEAGIPRIVTVGRLVASKRFDLVIQAIERLHSKGLACHLEIYGEGPDLNVLTNLVKERGLQEHVTFKGFSSTILNDIKDAAAFVLASTYEGMPNALLEAMALGVPCIATDCPIGGPRSVIETGVNGVLFPVGDLEALTSGLEALLRDRGAAEALGQAGTQLRDRLSVEKIVREWESWIEQVRSRRS